MKNNAFLYFLTLLLFKERAKHIPIVIISVVIIFLLSSVLFISSSIQYSLEQTLESQPDFVISRIQGGVKIPAPATWGDEVAEIYGVSKITPRVYGRYFFKDKGKSFLVIGVDFMEEQSQNSLEKLIETTDIKTLLNGNKMLVGSGVKRYLSANFYEKSYNFLTPSGEFVEVGLFDTLPKQINLIANDMIIMPIDLARKIIGLGEDEVTDVAFDVPNPDEWDKMSEKVATLHYDLRVVSRAEVSKTYKNLYNYKGGVFLILFLIVLVTFALILYQRYSMVYSSERRHVGLLRALGWSINDVLKLKFVETLMIVLTSFVIGIFLAYTFVFILGAPALKEIFLGGQNLQNMVDFVPAVEISVLASIFLLFAIPFLASVLIPVWRVSVSDPKEAML